MLGIVSWQVIYAELHVLTWCVGRGSLIGSKATHCTWRLKSCIYMMTTLLHSCHWTPMTINLPSANILIYLLCPPAYRKVIWCKSPPNCTQTNSCVRDVVKTKPNKLCLSALSVITWPYDIQTVSLDFYCHSYAVVYLLHLIYSCGFFCVMSSIFAKCCICCKIVWKFYQLFRVF